MGISAFAARGWCKFAYPAAPFVTARGLCGVALLAERLLCRSGVDKRKYPHEAGILRRIALVPVAVAIAAAMTATVIVAAVMTPVAAVPVAIAEEDAAVAIAVPTRAVTMAVGSEIHPQAIGGFGRGGELASLAGRGSRSGGRDCEQASDDSGCAEEMLHDVSVSFSPKVTRETDEFKERALVPMVPGKSLILLGFRRRTLSCTGRTPPGCMPRRAAERSRGLPH
jgi:hypothetical protein